LALGLPASAAAALDADPASYDWGNIDRYQQSSQQNFSFANSGVDPVIAQASLSGPDAAQFTLTNDGCSNAYLNPGDKCNVSVFVAPQAVGALAASLDVDDGTDTTSVALSATSLTGTIAANPDPIAFSPQPWFYGSQYTNVNVQAQNYGVAISSVQITGPDQGLFSINYDGCSGGTWQTFNSCSVGVAFNPTAATGPAEANLVISSDSGDSPDTVPISADALSGPDPQLSPAAKDYGAVALGSSSGEQTFTMTNAGDFPNQVQQVFVVSGTPQAFPISDDDCTLAVVMPGESCTFKVAFAPTTLGSKEASIFVINSGPSPVTQVGLTGQAYAPPDAGAVIEGDPEVGKMLDCNAVNTNGDLSYEWRRNGGPIAGADGASYQLVNDDRGARISCRITATNPLGSETADSPQTAPVAARDLAGDPHSLVDETSCRVVQVDPIDGVEVTGTGPATPDSPLTFSARKRIDVQLGTLERTGKRVRFNPRRLSGLADGSQPLSIDGAAGEAILAPCALSGRVEGSRGGQSSFAISGSTGIKSGEIRTPKLSIRPRGRSIGEVTAFAHGSPDVRFPITGRSSNYNGIRIKLARHEIEVSGLLDNTSVVQVDLDRGVVHGRGGTAKAKARLQGRGVARAGFRTAWR
jgi:hypothetical protein